MTLTLFTDLLVAGLLVAAIAYCVLLNRRLGALRSDKDKLEAAIQSLHGVSLRAEAGVAGLRNAAEEIGRQLQQKIDHGQSLRDDLAYMLERGGGLADRLEGAIRHQRVPAAPEAPAAETPAAEAPRPEPAPAASPGRKRRAEPVGPSLKAEPDAAPAVAASSAASRVAGFPSRSERELRRALERRG